MPHFLADTIKQYSTPSNIDEIEFVNEFSNKYEKLIQVRINEISFFLTQVKTKDGMYLIKPQKQTRIPNIPLIQKTLLAYSQLSCANIIHQNIITKKEKPQKDFLQKIKDIIFLQKLFNTMQKNKQELVVEIGFGSGRHILKKTQENKDIIHIGLELHTPSIEQVAKLSLSLGIDNLYLCKIDARVFVQILPSNICKAIYVHFPVPWDKKPNRRIYSNDFIEQAIRVLNKNGTLELRTDSDNYYEYVIELFDKKNIQISKQINKDLDISSKYEDRWKKQSKNIYDIIYKNKIISPPQYDDFDFDFDCKINTFKNIENTLIKKDDYLIHFHTKYKNDKNQELISVTFGQFDKVENNLIFLDKNKCGYFKIPAKTQSNIKSHKKILNLLRSKI